MTTAVVVLIDGFEEIEALATVDILRRGGVDVTTASLTDSQVVTGGHNIPVQADAMFADVDAQGADVLIIPGGTTAFDDHEGLKKEVVARAEADKYVGRDLRCPHGAGWAGLAEGQERNLLPGFREVLRGCSHSGCSRGGGWQDHHRPWPRLGAGVRAVYSG